MLGYNYYGQCTTNTLFTTQNKYIPNLLNYSECTLNQYGYEIGAICNVGEGDFSRTGVWTCTYPDLQEIECVGNNNINDCSEDPEYSIIGGDCTIGSGSCSASGKYYCDTSDNKIKCNAVLEGPCVEKCNGLDDNENGLIDEGFNIGDGCTVGVGICKRVGEYICSADNNSSICSEVAGEAGIETCDNLGTDDDCVDGIDNGVIFVDNQCYDKNNLKNFEDCNPLDAVIVDNYCYKRSDYNKDDNELNGNIKPLPPIVTVTNTQGKIEILMEKFKIGDTLKKKLQKKALKKYGIKRAKLRVYYEYIITPIKGNIKGVSINALAKDNDKKNQTRKKTVKRNKGVEKGLKTGNYKIQYKIVVKVIVNRNPVPIQTNKLSNPVKFAITGK